MENIFFKRICVTFLLGIMGYVIIYLTQGSLGVNTWEIWAKVVFLVFSFLSILLGLSYGELLFEK